MDWFHCNKCLKIGQGSGADGVLWFTSCGHIVCTNCMKQGGPSPGHKAPCLICQRMASVLEISRAMKPELLEYFKEPKDQLMDYTKRVKKVLDFQAGHRQALQKKMQEKCEKAVKFARAAQAEIARRAEREKALIAERNNLKDELEKLQSDVYRTERMLKERDDEIHRLRKRQNSPHHRKSAIPSLNGNTPITTLSFFNCETSTPNELRGDKNGGAMDLEALFRAHQQQNDVPLGDEMPVAGAGHHAFGLTTPYLLGIGGAKRTFATPKAYF